MMMNEENYPEWIEQYLSEKLTGEPLRAFEAKLLADARFKREVENQRNIVRNVKLVGQEDLRRQLKQFHQETVTQEPRVDEASETRTLSGNRQRKLFPYYAIAASIALVIFAGWLYTTQFRRQPAATVAVSPTPPQLAYIPYQIQNQDQDLGFGGKPVVDTTIAILIYPDQSSGQPQYWFDDTLRLYGTLDTRKLSLRYNQSAERYALQLDSLTFPLKRYADRATLLPDGK